MRGMILFPSLLLLFSFNPEGLHATVDCPKIASPGRVRCELVASVDAPRAITWADVEVVRAPSSVLALKGRLGPGDATAKGDAAWRFGFALVAREAGASDVDLRVRAIVCEADRCVPRELDVTAHVVVGK
jgi:hypothetical protein